MDAGLPAGLGVIDLAELSLSSLSGSVSRDSSAMHQQGCPLWYLLKGREIIQSNGKNQLAFSLLRQSIFQS